MTDQFNENNRSQAANTERRAVYESIKWIDESEFRRIETKMAASQVISTAQELQNKVVYLQTLKKEAEIEPDRYQELFEDKMKLMRSESSETNLYALGRVLSKNAFDNIEKGLNKMGISFLTHNGSIE